jgi:PPIC-type peptidyl-prolyl cis-trans isomerase-like protein
MRPLMICSIFVLLSFLAVACQAPGPGREDRVAQPAAARDAAGEVEEAEPEIIESRFGDLEETVAVGRGKGPDFLEFSRPDDRVVARVGGETLRKSQAFDYLLRTYPDKVRASIAVMLGNRVLAAECDRWGIRIGAREIETWWSEQERQLERQAKLDLGPNATLEDFVRQRIGQELSEYREVARDRERAKRLLSRLVRFHQIRSDRIELRIVSVTDRDGALQIRKWLKEGAEFAAVARRYSVHPSAENGGRLPPIWRGALHPELDEVAFGLAEGETGPVVHVRDAAGRDRYQIARVLRRLPGREVSWGEVEAQVLASLEKEPLSPDEWTLWQIRVDRLVEVELQGL